MNQYLVKISVDEARPYAELKIHAENLVDCGEQLLHLGLKRADIDRIDKKVETLNGLLDYDWVKQLRS